MGQYDGGNNTVDASGWDRPTSDTTIYGHPAPTERGENGTQQRAVTPEPEASAINRNFSRNSR